MKEHLKRFLSIVRLSLLVAFYHTLIDLSILLVNLFLFKNIGSFNNSIVTFIFVGLIVGIVIELTFLLPAALIYRFIYFPYRARIFIATILFTGLKLFYLYHNDGDAPILTQNLFLFTSYTLTSLYFFYLLFKNLSDELLTGENSLAARFQYWWSEKLLGND